MAETDLLGTPQSSDEEGEADIFIPKISPEVPVIGLDEADRRVEDHFVHLYDDPTSTISNNLLDVYEFTKKQGGVPWAVFCLTWTTHQASKWNGLLVGDVVRNEPKEVVDFSTQIYIKWASSQNAFQKSFDETSKT